MMTVKDNFPSCKASGELVIRGDTVSLFLLQANQTDTTDQAASARVPNPLFNFLGLPRAPPCQQHVLQGLFWILHGELPNRITAIVHSLVQDKSMDCVTHGRIKTAKPEACSLQEAQKRACHRPF